MRRHLLNVLTALSLLLCVAVFVLWVRGYWVTEYVWVSYSGGGTDTLSWSRGQLRFRHSTWPSIADTGSVGRDVGSARLWYCRRPPGTLHADPLQRSYRQYGRWTAFSWAANPRREIDPKELQELATAREALAQAEAETRPVDRPAGRPDDGAGEAERLLVLLRRVERLQIDLRSRTHSEWELVFPAWLLLVAASALPTRWLLKLRLRRHTQKADASVADTISAPRPAAAPSAGRGCRRVFRDVLGTACVVLFILSLGLYCLFMILMGRQRKGGAAGWHPMLDYAPGNVIFMPRLLNPLGRRYRRRAIFWFSMILVSVGGLLTYRATGPALAFPNRSDKHVR